jgi:positive regulator of sigma E activity
VTRVVRGGSVEVEFEARPRCQGCDGACVWLRLPAAQRMTFNGGQDLSVGERVVVALPDRYLFIAALLAHGLPLASLLAGAVLGFATIGGDAGAVLGALAGLVAALLAARALRASFERRLLRRVELRIADARSGSV